MLGLLQIGEDCFSGKRAIRFISRACRGKMGDKRRNIIVPDDVLMLQEIKKKNSFIEKV